LKFYTNVVQRFDKILVRGFEDGQRIKEEVDFSPTLYVLTKNKSEYKTLDGKDVEPINPGTMSDCKEFFKKYSEVNGFPIYGMDNYTFQYISDNYSKNDIKYDLSKINLFTIDIEVSSEEGFPNVFDCSEQVLAITLQNYNTKDITCFGVKPYVHNNPKVTYILCDGEIDLFNKFLDFWQYAEPDVITGWNCELYDIPYIVGRIKNIFGDKEVKRLSPWGYVRTREVEISGRTNLHCEMSGISVIDYLNLYKKFTYVNQESYALNHIASVELNQEKVDHSEYETFKDFYTNDWNKFVDYNIQDVVLVDKLEEKLKLIELCIMMAYNAKINYSDVFYQVRMWDAITYNYLKNKNIAIPQKVSSSKNEKFEGAYVKEPTPGMYDWVVSFDLASLYPSLIMMYNISPETLLDVKHPSISINKVLSKQVNLEGYEDYSVCPNGCLYRKDIRGFFPELVEKMFNDRKLYKKKMLEVEKEYEKTPSKELSNLISEYNNIQMNLKICLNSLYGALGNQYFRYYKLDNAKAVTFSGQTVIKWIESKLNEYLNKIVGTSNKDFIIALDTDSNYLHLGPLVEKFFPDTSKVPKEKIIDFIDKICDTTFQEYINKSFQELSDYTNSYNNTLYMKREAICDRAIWTKKKRYILNVWDNEGVRYEEPKVKIKGLEAIKSSTPAVCRKMIKDAVPIMMNKTEQDMIDYIKKCKDKFMKFSIEEISFPRSANNLDVYGSSSEIYKKGTPMHVRGSLLYNYYIKKKKLDNKYPLIQNGEKVKYCALQVPNPIREDVISFIQNFPGELDLGKYVDYNTQYNKSFLEPLKTILDAIGWKTEKTVNLANFYR
jgi:DNA polymerase elongation subunit (family B)